MITTVTITGADDSIRPQELLSITNHYPFVEWALLVSRSSTGHGRFPSIEWIKELQTIAPDLKISCHLCGAYVRELLLGDIDFITNELDDIWNQFQRVQINTHGIPHAFNHSKMLKALNIWPEKEFIFQYDNANSDILLAANRNGVNCSALFDLSHGAGVSPSEWPDLLPGIKCGYAGGISPKNIKSECIRVSEKTGEVETWIDMETHVRSNNDKDFDLTKVESCLSQSEPFVKELAD